MTYIVGDFDRGMELIRQSLELFRALGDELAVAHLRGRFAIEAIRTGDHARARALAEESLDAHRRVGSRSGEAMALGPLAQIEWAEGNPDTAINLAARSAEAAAAVGFTWWQMHQVYHQCEWSLSLGRIADADRFGREALRLAASIHDRQLIVYMLAILAGTTVTQGNPERAGVLWGAVEAEEQRGPVGQWEAERGEYAARVRADGEAFERGRVRGFELPLGDAIDYALQT
jgi:hypothetical protein